MAAAHEYLRLGDSTITGIKNDEVAWKLDGEGFTEYAPNYSTILEIPCDIFQGLPYLRIPMKIWAFGSLRFIKFGPVTATVEHVDIPLQRGLNPGINVYIPEEHRPVVPVQQILGTLTSGNLFPLNIRIFDTGRLEFRLPVLQEVAPMVATTIDVQPWSERVVTIDEVSDWYDTTVL
jgi:hypothetical protein